MVRRGWPRSSAPSRDEPHSQLVMRAPGPRLTLRAVQCPARGTEESRGTAAAAKLTELEQALLDLARAQQRTEAAQQRTEANLDRLEGNLDRSAAETRANLDRLEANLDRSAAKNDKLMADLARSMDEVSRQVGEAANRTGRLVEDILAPGIEEFFCKTFPFEGDLASAIRFRRGPRDARREFDAFVTGGDHFLLIDAKSTVRPERIVEFVGALPELRPLFPEARDRQFHGAIASLHIEPSLVAAGERLGLFMIGLRPGLLTMLNSPGFAPRAF